MAEGIEVRTAKDGSRSYRAAVWSAREQRRVRKTFSSLAAAKAWRAEAQGAVRSGRLRAASAPLLATAIEELLQGMQAGTVRTRGRRTFKPATRRAVEQNYRRRVAERYGRVRLDRITHIELQEFVDRLDAGGMNASTIEGAILPLRLVYRWARGHGTVAEDPTEGLELPEKTSGRRVPPAPGDAARLLAAVPDEDRAWWATAMLAGPRRGELLALDFADVDLKAGKLRIERSYDPTSGTYGLPKSRKGVRAVPITSTLAPYLREHMMRCGRRDGLLFGATSRRPCDSRRLQDRADDAWDTAGFERVTLHQCRHLYASMSIAAGVNAHALCRYMGHSSIAVTFDLYGHLFPGNEHEAAALLDDYLARAFLAAPAVGGAS